MEFSLENSNQSVDSQTNAPTVKRPRVVTSAIEGMSVSEVRKYLEIIRKQWKEKSYSTPFFLCDHINDSLTFDEFACQFVMGHHFKRHKHQ